jgi:membrane protease YdiL (CAAX protease family)
MGHGETRLGWPKASWVLAYLSVYFGYLWLAPEGELGHWASMVVVPWLLVWILTRRSEPGVRIGDIGRRLGLVWPSGSRGMGLALFLIAFVQVVQLLNVTQRQGVFEILSSPRALWIIPAALVFTLLTAGFTEEFFFRGIVQRALTKGRFPHARGIIAASVLFSLYHVPYAYLNPFWPSSGDLVHAIRLAFANGLLGGVILGVLFARSGGSLLPCVLVHAAVDWMPAIRLLSQLKVQM